MATKFASTIRPPVIVQMAYPAKRDIHKLHILQEAAQVGRTAMPIPLRQLSEGHIASAQPSQPPPAHALPPARAEDPTQHPSVYMKNTELRTKCFEYSRLAPKGSKF